MVLREMENFNYLGEVNMTLPTAESDTFTIVNTTPIFSEEYRTKH